MKVVRRGVPRSLWRRQKRQSFQEATFIEITVREPRRRRQEEEEEAREDEKITPPPTFHRHLLAEVRL